MRAIGYLLLFLTLFSCGSQKNIETTPVRTLPSWVTQKPIDNNYYAGIGMAQKSSTPDYLSIAKNNALQDLSSEISVNINSTSMLYQVEQNQIFTEEFKANTQLRTIQNLEGFELVDVYENDKEYWVFYRLSKVEFDRLKKERKQKALSQSLDFYEKAQNFKTQFDYDDALIYTVKAIESIKEYLGEALLLELNGKQVFYGNELYAFLNTTVNEIRLTPVQPQIKVTRGMSIEPNLLSFSVTNKKNIPLHNLPVYFYYSGNRIKNKQVLSNATGLVQFNMPKIISTNKAEYFTANLNMVEIAKEATEDPFIAKLISKISGPEARINIEINSPNVYIKASEFGLGQKMNQNILENAFKQAFLKAQINIVDLPEQADFFLHINSATEKIESGSGFYGATLKADIDFYNADLILLYTYQIVNVKGVQLDYPKASLEAYKKAADQIENRIFRELRRNVFE